MASMLPGSRLGRYEIVERLGSGGMATVFKARDPALDRYVAVKVLPSYDAQDSTFLSRFTQEARSIARLRHPNILQVYDSGDDKGFAFIVTEFIPGGTLHQKLVDWAWMIHLPFCVHWQRPLIMPIHRASCTATSSPQMSS